MPATQVCVSVPQLPQLAGFVCPGAQSTHAPATHTGVLPEHGTPTAFHAPDAVQTVGWAPWQPNEPGAQPASAASPADAASATDASASSPESTVASGPLAARHVPPAQVSALAHATWLQHGWPAPPHVALASWFPASATDDLTEPPQAPASAPQAAQAKMASVSRMRSSREYLCPKSGRLQGDGTPPAGALVGVPVKMTNPATGPTCHDLDRGTSTLRTGSLGHCGGAPTWTNMHSHARRSRAHSPHP